MSRATLFTVVATIVGANAQSPPPPPPLTSLSCDGTTPAGCITQKNHRVLFITHGDEKDDYSFWNSPGGIKQAAILAGKDFGLTMDWKIYQDAADRLANQASDIEALVTSSNPPDLLVVTLANAGVTAAVQKVVAAGIPVAAINSGFLDVESLNLIFFSGQHEIVAGERAAQYMIDRGVTNPIFISHGTPHTMPIDRVPFDAPSWSRDRWIGFNRTWVEKKGIYPRHEGFAGLPGTEQKTNATNHLVSQGVVNGQCTKTCNFDGVMTAGYDSWTVVDAVLNQYDCLSSTIVGSVDLNAGAIAGILGDRLNFAIDQQSFMQGYTPVAFGAMQAFFGMTSRPTGAPTNSVFMTGPAMVHLADSLTVRTLASSAVSACNGEMFPVTEYATAAAISQSSCSPMPSRSTMQTWLLAHGSSSDPFWTSLVSGALKAASDLKVPFNYTLGLDASGIVSALTTLCTASSLPTAIAVAYIDSSILAPIVTCQQAGVAVMTVNAGYDASADPPIANGNLNHIGMDDYAMGVKAAAYLVAQGKTTATCVKSGDFAPINQRCAGMASVAGLTTTTVSSMGSFSTEAVVLTSAGTQLSLLTATGFSGTIGVFDTTDEVNAAMEAGTVAFRIETAPLIQGYASVVLAVIKGYTLQALSNYLIPTNTDYVLTFPESTQAKACRTSGFSYCVVEEPTPTCPGNQTYYGTGCVCIKGFTLQGAECVPCPAGTSKNEAGNGACSACTARKSSLPGSTECTICAPQLANSSLEGFYADPAPITGELTCLNCPTGASCLSPEGTTIETLTINPGYWRASSTTIDISVCEGDDVHVSKSRCAGGLHSSGSSPCKGNSTGPLCQMCPFNNGVRQHLDDDKECVDCPDLAVTSVVLTIVILAMLIFLGILYYFYSYPPEGLKGFVKMLRLVLDTAQATLITKMKMAFAFYQIITSLEASYDIGPIPTDFLNVLKFFRWVEFDWTVLAYPKGCLSSYLERLYVTGFGPIILIVAVSILLAVGTFIIELIKPTGASDDGSKRSSVYAAAGNLHGIVTQSLPFVILVIFVMLPTTARHIFSSWLCIPYQTDDALDTTIYYMARDGGTQCYTDKHDGIVALAICLVIFWPVGMQLLLYLVTYSNRNVLLAGKTNQLSHSTRFLTGGYKPSWYYWESIDLFRRIFVMGWIVLIPYEQSTLRLFTAQFVSLLILVVTSYAMPYKRAEDNVISLLCQTCLLIVYNSATLLRVSDSLDLTDPEKYDLLGYSDSKYFYFIIISITLLFLIFYLMISMYAIVEGVQARAAKMAAKGAAVSPVSASGMVIFAMLFSAILGCLVAAVAGLAFGFLAGTLGGLFGAAFGAYAGAPCASFFSFLNPMKMSKKANVDTSHRVEA